MRFIHNMFTGSRLPWSQLTTSMAESVSCESTLLKPLPNLFQTRLRTVAFRSG
jgi:hypothetical protein